MDAYGIAILGSLIVYIVVGNLAGRKVKGLDDYFVAGRNAPTILILGTLVASVIGTNSFLGDVGMAYSGMSSALIFSVSMPLPRCRPNAGIGGGTSTTTGLLETRCTRAGGDSSPRFPSILSSTACLPRPCIRLSRSNS